MLITLRICSLRTYIKQKPSLLIASIKLIICLHYKRNTLIIPSSINSHQTNDVPHSTFLHHTYCFIIPHQLSDIRCVSLISYCSYTTDHQETKLLIYIGLTTAPSPEPTAFPSSGPTTDPSSSPTVAPSSGPTIAKSSGPTALKPTREPSHIPTKLSKTTREPSHLRQTVKPTREPSIVRPTLKPTREPSRLPTQKPNSKSKPKPAPQML